MSNRKRIFAEDLGVELVLDEEIDPDFLENEEGDEEEEEEEDEEDENELHYRNKPHSKRKYDDHDKEASDFNNIKGKRHGLAIAREDGERNNNASTTLDDYDTRNDLDDQRMPRKRHRVDSGSTSSLQQSSKRCKDWPQCKNTECKFHHPNKPCKNFPRCTFGNECLYIHPPCKYNPSCENPRCIFAHTSDPQAQWPEKPPAPKCKFGHKCMNVNCKFSHQRSEPCRFGVNCLLDGCPFSHPAEIARKKPANAYKWTAQS